jgi:hypothetical protein
VSWLDEVREAFPNGRPDQRARPGDPFDAARATRGAGYARAALDAEVDNVLNAGNGTRNHTLNAAAFALGQLVAGGELDRQEVIAELSAAGHLVGLGDREIGKTILSGLAAGAKQPRTTPERPWSTAGTVPRDSPNPDGTPDGTVPSPVDEWVARLQAALVDSAGLDDIPDPEPLIGTDILFRDSLNWMVGKPGCMKSFTALDMAGCVGTGESWQGYPVSQGPVVYLVAEGVRGTKKRVRAWEKAMGRRMDDVYFLPVAVQASHGSQWDALLEVVRRIQPAMVVLDTQARITVGVEENSNTEMGRFVEQAERLRKVSGAAVLVVHHVGRGGDTGRGATTLDGAMSTIIRVTKEDDQVRLECTKNKDGVEWDDIELRAVPTEDSVVLMPSDGGRRAGTDGSPSHAAMKMARSWWDSHGDKWASNNSLVDVVAPRSTFFRHRQELERCGLVVENRDQRYPTFRLARDPYPVGEDPG